MEGHIVIVGGGLAGVAPQKVPGKQGSRGR